jgi:TolA-binding protein
MGYWCRWLLMLVTLIGGGNRLVAASAAENRAFNAAGKAFNLGAWEYADTKYAEFVQKYPKSARLPEAILLQAESQYHLDRPDNVLSLLSTNLNRAGRFQDEYLYLMAQAQFRNSNYLAAAETFARVIQDFPDSAKRLAASVGQATAFTRLKEWSLALELLEMTNGVFQQSARSTPTNAWVTQGFLVAGEAHLARRDYDAVEPALSFLDRPGLTPELSWRREYLLGRLQLGRGQTAQALQTATNLLALADVPPLPPRLTAESRAFQAAVFEEMNLPTNAIAAYEANLATNAPVDQQRQALLKIAELKLALDRPENPPEAIKTLEQYLEQHPASPAADMAVLAMGELRLKQAVTAAGTNAGALTPAGLAAVTNFLAQAVNRFDLLTNTFPNSPLVGKALLNKGWCFWQAGELGRSQGLGSTADFARSHDAFQLAVAKLPFSEDQAVARFKWADAQFELNDWAGALTNYEFLVTNYVSRPEVKPHLIESALYQIVLVALTNDLAAATRAMHRILDWYPDGFAGPHCLLLVGQGMTQQSDPAGARALFTEFETRFPGSPLLPLVRLAVARSFEQENNWDAAVRQYADWIGTFTNHEELARAEFCRARDCFKAGQETNALALFTNFVARFPSNELARQTQWWIGGYYFNLPDFQNAEKNYQLVYTQLTNLPPSELTYQAQMMAGRAAMARLGYSDAIRDYFMPLAANTNCSPGLRDEAVFAWGDALVSRDSTNKFADFRDAVVVFSQIAPTNILGVPALGRIGDCRLQLAALAATNAGYYADAANAYRQVLLAPLASASARSQAKVALGRVAEGLAGLKTGEEQSALLQQAFDQYLDVFLYENSLREDEQADPFWVKESGLKAARLAEKLQRWPEAVKIYEQLEQWFPALRSLLEKRTIHARESLPQSPNL